MARRLALLALLACAVASLHPRAKDSSASESDEPFLIWEEYEDSLEASPRPSTPKVILRSKAPKVNVTMKKKSDDKNKIIKTTINIESHTNFIVTRRTPVTVVKPQVPQKQTVIKGDNDIWVDINASTPRTTTKKSNVVRRSTTIRTTTRSPSTTKKYPRTTARQPTTTARRTTKRKYQLSKSTKAPKQNFPCPSKNSGLVYDEKLKRPSKKTNSGWFGGFFTTVYKWIVGSKSSWFGGGWFQEPDKKFTTTTTPIPPSTSTENWFQSFLNLEDYDKEQSSPNESSAKKSNKKALKKSYKGYQLLRSYPDTQWKVRSLLDLQEEGEGSGLMWWTLPSLNGSTDLLVPPDLLVDVKDHLKSSNIEFEVIIWDLQKAISYENPKLSKKQRLELVQLRGHPMTWRRYHRYADILRYLEYLQHSYSDVVELIPLGRSSEGLPLVAVKISLPVNDTNTENASTKSQKKKWKLRYARPAIWIDGGAHAREWIAPAVASWLIHNLVEGEKDMGVDYEVLKTADFYIMPVLNPDGYEHSHTHDRLWRKTRSRLSDSDDYYVGWFPWNWGRTECVGVDADRNWDYHWREKDSSQDPCSDNYAGPHPFSEPETRAVSEFLAEHRGQIKVYLSLHAYSQSWLLPSSHAQASFSDDGVLMEMGKLATTALADVFGTKYKVGTAADIQQPASGMAHDWAKARAGIKFAYHVDLRDSFGPYGFLLPGSQIVSTAREIWQSIKAIVDNLSP